MTKSQLASFQQQLYDVGRRLTGNVSTLATEALRDTGGAANGNLSSTPVHPADLGSDSYEQDVALTLLENQELQLEEVASALARIEKGTYGRCETCDCEIAQERLKALPYTRHCVSCSTTGSSGAESPRS